MQGAVQPLHTEIAELKEALKAAQAQAFCLGQPCAFARVGYRPLPVRITGIRQLTPRVRAYELRTLDGGPLPAIQAGAHLMCQCNWPRCDEHASLFHQL